MKSAGAVPAHEIALVAEVERRLAIITTCLVTLSRLHCLYLLWASDRYVKLKAAENVALYAELAVKVEQFSTVYLQHKSGLVSWPSVAQPDRCGILEGGCIEVEALRTQLEMLGRELIRQIVALEGMAGSVLLAAPVLRLLSQLRPQIVDLALEDHGEMDMTAPAIAEPLKVVSGPPRSRSDPIFVPTYSLLDTPPSLFSDELAKAVPYLWLECIRETLGADLCALNSVEYDGLPLAFYADMAKQAWDEMRHAIYYLDVSRGMIPELLEQLDESHELVPVLRRYLRGEGGLPVPIEGNLYEAVHNATLAERMLMFQVQTESAAAARKKHELRSSLCRSHPELRAGIEYDIRDEITHARIGKTWLAYLLPDKQKRREAASMTALLRSMLILTSFAHAHQVSLRHVVDRCLAPTAVAARRRT